MHRMTHGARREIHRTYLSDRMSFSTAPRVAPDKHVPVMPGAVHLLTAGASGNAMDNNQALTWALAYLNIGWWVLPLKAGTKQPANWLVPNGVHGASNSPEVVRRWWTTSPECGIGIAIKPSGLVCVDIDPRNGGFETLEALESKHGALLSDVLQYTGGGGEHRIFSASLVESLPGTLGKGIDLKADGYFCAEPTIHPNGNPYGWELSSNPVDGCIPSTLLGWVRDLGRGPFAAAPFIPAVRLVDPQQVADLRAALATIPADDYHQWVNFGNALSELGQAGFLLWDEWSQKSDKYSPAGVTAKWRSFKPGAIQIESIFFEAQRVGWANPAGVAAMPEPVPIETVKVLAPQVVPMPDGLLRPPGVLGEVTDWINATSSKPQPMFAVQAALAFGCAVLGRRFATSQHNWPTLYLLNIGKSASGKEHAKWAVEQLLEACNMPHLIGPASYTSGAGVLSALHTQPSHLTVIDEFGKELERASVKNDTRIKDMLKTLIEAWGRCHGVMRPAGYSTFGLSQKDAESMQQRTIRNPALSMLAMTTPETFFDTIGSASARDGFLNRFLIVESDIGRQVRSAHATTASVPESVVAWAKAMHERSEGVVGHLPSVSPTPALVGLSGDALRLFADFDAHCLTRMDEHEIHGLAEMYGRSNEMAMRVALLLAVGCHRGGDDQVVIGRAHAQWAVDYVGFHADRTVTRLVSSMHDSAFEAVKQQVMQCLMKAGERGRTNRELYDYCRKVRGLSKRQQVELMDSLMFVGKVQLVKYPSPSGRGKPRDAWVAVDDGESNNADKDAPLPPEDAPDE